MNYFGTVEAITRTSEVRRRARARGNRHNGNGLLWRSPAIIRPAADMEHAGIARTVRFIARHFRRPIRVTDLMAVAGLSRRGLLKSFRKHTGRAPGEVLRLTRIEHAKQLLAGRDLTLAQLAAAVGFRKTNSFAVAFRSVTGLSPTKYQLLVREKINGHGVRPGTSVTGQRCARRRAGYQAGWI